MSATMEPGASSPGADEPGHGTSEAPGEPPPAPPGEPPAAGPPASGPPAARTGPGDGARPAPHAASLAGAIAAGLLLSSLVVALAQLGDHRRIGGILIGLGFEGLGVLLLLAHRGRRAQTGGIGLTAIGLIPLLVYLFVDVDDPSGPIDSVGDFTGTATAVLLVAAALWGIAYCFGPTRGYGIYLGGALIALWLVAVVQIVDQPLSQLATGFTGTSTFQTIGPSEGYEVSTDPANDEWYNSSPDGADDEFGESSTTLDPYDDEYDSFDDYDSYDSYDDEDDGSVDEYPSIDDPSTKLGWASLVFGVGYLAVAGVADRRGARRRATPMLAAALPILTYAVGFLSGPFHEVGTALLAMTLGAAAVYVATVAAAPDGRRFTGWYGAVAVTVGILVLVGHLVRDDKVAAGVLLVLGAAVAVVAARLEGSGAPPTEDGEPEAPVDPEAGTDGPPPRFASGVWPPPPVDDPGAAPTGQAF